MLGVTDKSSTEISSRFDNPFQCAVVTGSYIDKAIEIRQRVYIEEFGFDLGGHGPRDALDERAVHLLATTTSGEPVGSLRLIDASARPFEIEAFLDISKCLTPDRHPAEITRLCILAPYRRISRAAFVHLAILEAVMRLARRLGITDFIASTRADLLQFYQYLLFETFPGAVYAHPEIGNAPHTLMRLDLTTVLERYRSVRPTLYRAVEAAFATPSTEAPH
jgi:N-acyl-L-homoserine lactone synthetase